MVGLDTRERNRRFVDRVVVKAVGRGRRVHPAERCSVYLVGSSEPVAVPSFPDVLIDQVDVALAPQTKAVEAAL